MARELPEWRGRSDDTPVPPRVRVRVFLKFDGICQECGLKIAHKRWICDHRIALKNGGENRESNLGPIHEACDKTKTKADVAEKAKVYRKIAKNLGVRLKSTDGRDGKPKGRPMFGSRASGYKKHLNGSITKRQALAGEGD